MSAPWPAPREGGIKIVFDVADADVDDAIVTLTAAGFHTARYYPPGHAPTRGGAPTGRTRLGAERTMSDFDAPEPGRVAASFEAASRAAGLECHCVGTDVWTAE